MRNLFNLDGPLMQLINKVVYSVYLNILWFICCIPIVTIGASTTALFYVTLKIAKNDEGNITKAFFHSFRVNLKQSTIVWMILLCMGIILGVDGYVVYHMRYENAFWTLCTAFLIMPLSSCIFSLLWQDLKIQLAQCLKMRCLWASGFCSAPYQWLPFILQCCWL